MLVMPGSLYLANDRDFVCNSIARAANGQRIMALDMDEQDSFLIDNFPGYVVKATILLPPPTAVFKEIDGDADGFIAEYLDWLKSDMVTEYLSSILLMVYDGINTFIYIPSFSEDSIWINVFLDFMRNTFGLNIGTSAQNGFKYDNNFDTFVMNMMYYYNCINELQYLSGLPTYYLDIPPQIWAKLSFDLLKYGSKGENPSDIYRRIRLDLDQSYLTSAQPIRPLIQFDTE